MKSHFTLLKAFYIFQDFSLDKMKCESLLFICFILHFPPTLIHITSNQLDVIQSY